MQFEIQANQDWLIIRLGDRVDAFNEKEFATAMNEAMSREGKRIAVDFFDTKFISFNFIKSLARFAREFARTKNGVVALIQPSERIKRQIDIYSSLGDFLVYRRADDFDRQFQSQKWSSPQLDT